MKKKAENFSKAGLVNVTIPRCLKVQVVDDPATSLNQTAKCTLLHSSNPSYPLIDCIFRDKKGQIHAIQITTGEQHSMKIQGMNELYKKVFGSRTTNATKINLYYCVPSIRLKTFKFDKKKKNHQHTIPRNLLYLL